MRNSVTSLLPTASCSLSLVKAVLASNLRRSLQLGKNVASNLIKRAVTSHLVQYICTLQLGIAVDFIYRKAVASYFNIAVAFNLYRLQPGVAVAFNLIQ